MSLYSRNYGSWTSKGSGSAASDKPSSTSSLERGSRYGSASSINSGGSSSGLKTPSPGPSSYRSLSAVRDRAAQPESQQPDKPSIREKYASRTYGVEPEQKVEATPSYKRYGSAYSPTSETPSLRFGSSSRFGGQIARSPISEKSPTVFGVSGYTRPSKEDEKKKNEPAAVTETMTLVTRGTSPTPPSNSTFLRARRAEMDRTLEKTVPRLAPRHTTYSVECQTDEKYIEDAKLESKLSAANALTARTPSSSSYSRFSLNSKYTPRTSAYHGTRSTELTSPANSVSRTYTSHDDVKTEPSPTKDVNSKKLEGKDTTRIGGFSYARPTDLPVALNKAMADSDGKTDGLVSPSKIRSTSISPQTPTSMARSIKRDLGNLSSEQANKPYRSSLSRANSAGDTNEDTHSIKNDSPTPSVSVLSTTKASLSPSKSSAKLTSPDRCKLPPPSPKLELSKNIPNKDFRKSELNMNLSSSNESLNSQKIKSQRPTDQKSLERSPSAKLSKSPVGLATSKSLAKLPSSSPTPKSVQSIDKPLSTLLRPAMKKDSSESSSEDSSSTESSSSSETESSESDNEEHAKEKSNVLISAVAGSKLSLTPSRTSAQLSSADEASVSIDKPPRPPSSLRLNKAPEDKRTEEAKAVVVKALTPVTGLQKVMHPGIVDESSDKDNKSSVSLTGKLEKSASRASVGSTSNLQKSGSKSSLGSEKSGFKIHHTLSEDKLLASESLGKKETYKSDSEKSDPKADLQAKESDVLIRPITGKVEISGSRTSLGSVSKLEKSGSKSSLGSNTSIPYIQPGEKARLRSSSSDTVDKKTPDKSDSENNYVKVQLQDQEKVSDKESGPITSRTGKMEKSSSRTSLEGAPKCEKSSSKSSIGGENKNFKIQHILSGERAWWLGPPSEEANNKKKDTSDKEGNYQKIIGSDDNPNIPGSPSLREGNKSTSASENEMKPPIPQRLYKLKKAESGSSSDLPGLEKSPSSKSIRKDKSKSALYKIKRIESGERPWWLQESEGEDNTSSGIQDMPSDSQSIKEIDDGKVFETTQSSPMLQKKPYTITKIESGERAWWLGDGENSNKESQKKVVSTGSPGKSPQDSLVENSAQENTSSYNNPYKITKIESGERAWWLGDESKKDPPRPKSSTLTKRPKNLPLFIGRHTNIDDVLGTQAPPPAAFRTPQNSSDESDTDSEEIFEVKADDVKIHDSTAMMSSISRPNGMIKSIAI